MKFNRSIAAGITALVLLSGATACKSSTPATTVHHVVVVHQPAPVIGHTHITTTTRTQTHPITGKRTTTTTRTTTHH